MPDTLSAFQRRYQPGVSTFNANHIGDVSAQIEVGSKGRIVVLYDAVSSTSVGHVALDPLNDPLTATKFVVAGAPGSNHMPSFASIPAALRALKGSIPSADMRRRGLARVGVLAPKRKPASPTAARLLAGASQSRFIYAPAR